MRNLSIIQGMNEYSVAVNTTQYKDMDTTINNMKLIFIISTNHLKIFIFKLTIQARNKIESNPMYRSCTEVMYRGQKRGHVQRSWR